MIELKKEQCASVLPLLEGFPQHVLPWAICQGINYGRVFADNGENPRTTLIWTPVGYYFLAGELTNEKTINEIRSTLHDICVPASLAGGEKGLILISSSEDMKNKIELLLPDQKVFEIFRKPFEFSLSSFEAVEKSLKPIPDGFRLIKLDSLWMEKIKVSPSWYSLEDFLANGAGYALVENDHIASLCLSIFASRTAIELDVQTAEEYFGRGFGVLTAAAMIRECLNIGKQPNWECFWDNRSSISLAQKLGYVAQPEYPVYYWEESSR